MPLVFVLVHLAADSTICNGMHMKEVEGIYLSGLSVGLVLRSDIAFFHVLVFLIIYCIFPGE